MILSFIEVRPLPGNREKILELLQFLVDSLETRRGCLAAGVYEADGEKGTILYLEQWSSDEEFRRYVQSTLYLGVLNALDLAREPPVVKFHEVSDTKSMDLIVALRSPCES